MVNTIANMPNPFSPGSKKPSLPGAFNINGNQPRRSYSSPISSGNGASWQEIANANTRAKSSAMFKNGNYGPVYGWTPDQFKSVNWGNYGADVNKAYRDYAAMNQGSYSRSGWDAAAARAYVVSQLKNAIGNKLNNGQELSKAESDLFYSGSPSFGRTSYGGHGIGGIAPSSGKVGGWSYTDKNIGGTRRVSGQANNPVTVENEFWKNHNSAKQAYDNQGKVNINFPDWGSYDGDIATATRDFAAMNKSNPNSKTQFVWSDGNMETYVKKQMQNAISDKLKRGNPITDAERQVLYS